MLLFYPKFWVQIEIVMTHHSELILSRSANGHRVHEHWTQNRIPNNYPVLFASFSFENFQIRKWSGEKLLKRLVLINFLQKIEDDHKILVEKKASVRIWKFWVSTQKLFVRVKKSTGDKISQSKIRKILSGGYFVYTFHFFVYLFQSNFFTNVFITTKSRHIFRFITFHYVKESKKWPQI